MKSTTYERRFQRLADVHTSRAFNASARKLNAMHATTGHCNSFHTARCGSNAFNVVALNRMKKAAKSVQELEQI